MFLQRTGLGEIAPDAPRESFFERLLRVPAVERGIVDPLYATGERKAWESIKESVGPWVLGVGAALLFVNLYLLREVGRRRT